MLSMKKFYNLGAWFHLRSGYGWRYIFMIPSSLAVVIPLPIYCISLVIRQSSFILPKQSKKNLDPSL